MAKKLKITKTCIICQKNFVTYDVGERSKYRCCSRECANISKQGQKVSRILELCPICDNEFEKPNYSPKTYCSHSCQHKSLEFWSNATEDQKLSKLKEKYEKFVKKNDVGCWSWNGAKQKKYGTFSFDKKHMRAHRASWMLNFGPIPENKHVLHKCDNPPCTNPDHLFLGSHKENMIDMRSKGLHKQHSKLSKDQVVQIKNMLREKTQVEIARIFNVHYVTIHDIKHGKTWKHV